MHCLALIVLAILSTLTGKVIEEDTQQPAIQVVVQLLSEKDSSQVDVTVTNLEGIFKLKTSPGDFILKISSVGYSDQYRNIHLTSSQSGFDLGVIPISVESQMLNEAIVSAKVEPVTIVEDTVVYNAAAFRVAEDAMIGDLLKKIPGLAISGNTITLHGKKVEQLLVNGKKFFGSDVKTGLKNLPADIVENIRAYERQSDEAQLAGVEDEMEVPVIDLTIKEKSLGNWRGTANAGGGTKERMNGRISANKITKKEQITLIGGVDNVPDLGSFSNTAFSQIGGGSDGDKGNVEAGVNYNKTTDKLDFGGHIRYDGIKRYSASNSHSESISATKTSYSLSNSPRDAIAHIAKGDFSLQWKIRDDLIFYVKPSISYNYNGANNDPYSQTFSSALMDSCINESFNRTRVYSNTLSAGLVAQLTKRSNLKKGRSYSIGFEHSYKKADSDNFNDYHTLFLTKSTESRRKQYIDIDGNTVSYSPKMTYNEPLGKGTYFQCSVRGDFRTQDTDRNLYTFTKLFPDWNVSDELSLKAQKATLPQGWQNARDASVSYYGRYHYNALVVYGAFRYSKKKVYLSVGVTARPQWTSIDYVTADNPNGKEKSFIFNIAPSITLKYSKLKNKQISFTYRSWPGMPSMYDLLPVDSGTSPTYVHTGNSGLKPSFTHNASFSYNYSNLKKQNSFVSNVGVWMTQNAISNVSEYDAQTGVRSVIPQNIQGNWRAKASVGLTQTFKNTHFSLTDNAATEYSNSNSYLYNSSRKESEKNVTGRFIIKNNLEINYRNSFLELILSQGVEYTDENYSLKPQLHQQPLVLSGGMSATVIFPWRMRITGEYSLLHLQGYAISEMNRNFNTLNAVLTQPFLKNKLIVRLEGFDLLGELVNMTRNISSSSRSVTTYNGVTSYVMLSAVYKFNNKK